MDEEKIVHLKWMLENFPSCSGISIEEGKADRWLGFVQGALWAQGLQTIDTFRDDVREGRGLEGLKTYLMNK